ncbi:cyclic pyranopterin monophosphate synthase MoaC [Collinsella tanakaei]|uniref:cyclic pyranopterin monophosphate synthase MoaC n=1 Tax=Collinsella tanakaei TaxID=626935 RepID=UPI0025A497EA|nr:cyclic pyranopterin monophosphate synthase MoaC [Collinsella tanakaei]MDM8302417.1 cyclic pyranopterin monophosphate synthase MoaC [Collinsella tanakaei]
MARRKTGKTTIKRATGETYPVSVVGEPPAQDEERAGGGAAAASDAAASDGPAGVNGADMTDSTTAIDGVDVRDGAPAPAAHTAAPTRDGAGDVLTHVDDKGDVRMVDVSGKAVTQRLAVAEATILMHPETQAMVLEDRAKKGDVLACARVAGIMASKRTGELIPMCHPLMITKSAVDIEPIPASGEGARDDGRVGFRVQATCGVTGVTGIEMEALTAASVACLTIYDMCKAVDRGMEIVDVRLLRKEGGRSGTWEREDKVPATDAVPAVETPTAPADADAETPASPTSPLPGGPIANGAAAPAIAFIGYQNSGKTTLVEKVIARLTQRGLRVGSIKHHGEKNIEVDQPGKDSWRHARAGSRHVGLVSPGRFAEYADTAEEVPVADLLTHFTDVDVVVVEGYKTAGLPNIVVSRSGVDRLRGDSSYDLVDEHTVAIACNELVERDFRARAAKEADEDGEPRALPPFLNINDAAEIVTFIMRRLGRA